MIFPSFPQLTIVRSAITCVLSILLAALSWIQLLGVPPALASLNDDRFDGNIFALYGGNGALVPPKVTLAQALRRDKPVLLVFYLDDSRDCKQYSTVVSQLQAFLRAGRRFYPSQCRFDPVKVYQRPAGTRILLQRLGTANSNPRPDG